MGLLLPLVITGLSGSIEFGTGILILIFLFAASALVSASETAFFSLSPAQVDALKKNQGKSERIIIHILQNPNKLLATLLIVNNFVNLGIVLLSTYLLLSYINLTGYPIIGFLLQALAITFLLLLLGEVTPKVYAAQNAVGLSRFLAWPVWITVRLLSPVSYLLIVSTELFNRKYSHLRYNISVDDLSHAVDIASPGTGSERQMLKGIISFGHTEVRQVMTPRIDMAALPVNASFFAVLEFIRENAFSRIPVYDKTLDNITGILYIKDLLPHKNKPDNFEWRKYLHAVYAVPYSTRIDDLLTEFQKKHIHIAIAADEYGSTAGLVTLEDIIEEITGEISDEFDDDSLVYTRLDERTFLFEGKTGIKDVARIMSIDLSEFEKARLTSVTIGSFLVELTGSIPPPGKEVRFGRLIFNVESADQRRIELVKVTAGD